MMKLTIETMTEAVGQEHGKAFCDAATAALSRVANGKEIELSTLTDESGRSVVECSASIDGKEFVWADIIPAKENA